MVRYPSGSANAPLRFSWAALAAHAGPGLLVATAYLDPGNLEACVTAGASSGYALLWVLAAATAAGGCVQVLAVRLGVGGGADLAALASAGYRSRAAAAALWASTSSAVAGADIQALAGCAVALTGLSGGSVPPPAGVGLAAAASLGVLWVTTHPTWGSVRALEAVFACLVGGLAACLGVLAAKAPVDWRGGVLPGLVTPTLTRGDAPAAAAIVGSVLMTHNLFLHSACVQSRQPAPAPAAAGEEEEEAAPPPPPPLSVATPVQRAAAHYFSLEAGASLAVAAAVCAACVAVFATGRASASTTPPFLPPDVGLAGAAAWLATRFGRPVATVWRLGVLAAGQSAAMAGAFAAQHIAAGFGPRALGRAAVSTRGLALAGRAAAIVPAFIIACLPSSPLDAATQALNVVQALQLPFALIPLIRLASCPAAAGGLAVGRVGTAGAVVVAAAVLACNAGVAASAGGAVAGVVGVPGAVVGAAAYVAALIWLAVAPLDEAGLLAARAEAAAARRGGEAVEGGGEGARPLL